MKHSLHRIQVEWDAWEKTFDLWKSSNVTFISDGFQIQSTLADIPFVLRWLEDKGIPWNLGFDFITSETSSSRQMLDYENIRLSRTSTGFYFEEKQASIHFVIPGPGQYAFGNFQFTLEALPASQFVKDTAPEVEYISGDVIQWPLHIRSVIDGDSFRPIGMQGQHKKIQDLLVDYKLEMFEKERVLLLTNRKDVIWVMGYRLDERAKVKPDDQEIYKLSYLRTN
jgi:tRNA(Ile)-lysidine synthase